MSGDAECIFKVSFRGLKIATVLQWNVGNVDNLTENPKTDYIFPKNNKIDCWSP